MRKTLLYTISLLLVIQVSAQTKYDESKLFSKSRGYIPESVIDKKYGIMMFEPLNMVLGNDTVRNVKGYAANGYLKDYYVSGQLLHKGFYVDGQLKVYRNFYPNGKVERNFRLVDEKKCKMDLYYDNGLIKSKIVYYEGETLSWADYYRNGALEFIEVYDKNREYYIEKANYYEDGSPENTLELENKKKLIYNQTYYHSNGKVKKLGQMRYNKVEFDYENIGTWKIYDKNEKPIKAITYVNGTIKREIDL